MINIFDRLQVPFADQRGQESKTYWGYKVGDIVRCSGGPFSDEIGIVLHEGIYVPRFASTSMWHLGPSQIKPLYGPRKEA